MKMLIIFIGKGEMFGVVVDTSRYLINFVHLFQEVGSKVDTTATGP